MSNLTREQLDILLSPIHPSRVAQRDGAMNKSTGQRMKLSYVEGYEIKAMLTRVFGFGGWSWMIQDMKPVGNGFLVHGRLYIEQTGTTYDGVGVGTMHEPDDSIKAADTEALKRAASNLGDQFGLGLYNKGSLDPVVRKVFAPGQATPMTPADLRQPPSTPMTADEVASLLGGEKVDA